MPDPDPAPSPHHPHRPRRPPNHQRGVRVRRGATEVLRGIDLAFEPDRRYVLVGPSGSGKSTLLRLLNRLEDPAEGTILVGETPLASLPVRAVRSGVGMVFQAPRPLPGTVAENLGYPHLLRHRPAPPPEILAGLLARVGLDPAWLDRPAIGLSGGERQRLALAVALVCAPEILALDEPTSALDPTSARLLADLLADLAARTRLRTIAVCHAREHAPWLGDTTVALDAGRVVAVGPTENVLMPITSHE
jgi:putative ABC transport system ATP-binding protein